MVAFTITGDGFAVCHLGFVRDDFQVEAGLESMLDDIEMQRAHTRDDQFMRLRIAMGLESRVFFDHLGDALRNFLLIAPVLRFDRQAEHGGREVGVGHLADV